jgi:hypothetical protein
MNKKIEIKIPPKIQEMSGISATAKLLYGTILTLSSKYGFCYASNAFLANQRGINPRTVQKLLRKLEAEKLIKIRYSKHEKGGKKRREIVPQIGLREVPIRAREVRPKGHSPSGLKGTLGVAIGAPYNNKSNIYKKNYLNINQKEEENLHQNLIEELKNKSNENN